MWNSHYKLLILKLEPDLGPEPEKLGEHGARCLNICVSCEWQSNIALSVFVGGLRWPTALSILLQSFYVHMFESQWQWKPRQYLVLQFVIWSSHIVLAKIHNGDKCIRKWNFVWLIQSSNQTEQNRTYYFMYTDLKFVYSVIAIKWTKLHL